MTEKTLILKPSIGKTLLLLFVCLVFLLGSTFIFNDNQWIAWLGIIFFGLGSIVFTLHLIPGSSQLKLSEEGFTITSLFKSHLIKWEDIERFYISNIGRRKAVVFDYSKNHKKHNAGKAIAKAVAKVHGALPDNYGMKLEDLAKLLNEWKRKSPIKG